MIVYVNSRWNRETYPRNFNAYYVIVLLSPRLNPPLYLKAAR